jgi:GT2 family glycosyltransferase
VSRGKVLDMTRVISGMMMIIQKKTWKEFPFSDGLLSVDNDISRRLLRAGKPVRLIKGIYLLHYYRMCEGRNYKKHLLTETA